MRIRIFFTGLAVLSGCFALAYAAYSFGYAQAQHDFVEIYQVSQATLPPAPESNYPEIETDFAIDRVWVTEEDVQLCTTPEIAEAEKLSNFAQPGNFFETSQGKGCYMLRVSPLYDFEQVLTYLQALETKYEK